MACHTGSRAERCFTRIALDRENEQRPLSNSLLAQAVLGSAEIYQERQRWYITLFVLMPDHLHALLTFAHDESMSRAISDWKRFHARKNHVSCCWFVCQAEDWPWVIDPFR